MRETVKKRASFNICWPYAREEEEEEEEEGWLMLVEIHWKWPPGFNEFGRFRPLGSRPAPLASSPTGAEPFNLLSAIVSPERRAADLALPPPLS